MIQRFDKDLFGKAIKTKRVIELNINVREAANKIKISPATISRIENGGVAELESVIKACNWLGQHVSDFIVVAQSEKKEKSKN
jgi:DNA-binding Xre family transcriptional regulator